MYCRLREKFAKVPLAQLAWGGAAAVMKHGSKLFHSNFGDQEKEREIAKKLYDKRLNYPNPATFKKFFKLDRLPTKHQLKRGEWEAYPIKDIKKIRKRLGIKGLKKSLEAIYALIDLGGGKNQLQIAPKYIQRMRYREIEDQLKTVTDHEELKALQNQMPQETLVYICDYQFDPEAPYQDTTMHSSDSDGPTLDSMDVSESSEDSLESTPKRKKAKTKKKPKKKSKKVVEDLDIEWDEALFGKMPKKPFKVACIVVPSSNTIAKVGDKKVFLYFNEEPNEKLQLHPALKHLWAWLCVSSSRDSCNRTMGPAIHVVTSVSLLYCSKHHYHLE